MKKKSAVVTGASRGIGRACAVELAKCGYNVIVNYLKNEEAARETLDEIMSLGGEGKLFCADVSDSSQARRLISKCVMEYGGIDLLVNNAGIAQDGLFLQTSDEVLEKITRTNYYGTFFCAREAAREMITSGCGGNIINISSMWGIAGASCEAAYSASKAAVIGLTKSLAKELAPSGIRVNCIAPGVIDTEMNACYSSKTMDELKRKTPLGRLGTGLDVAAAVKFLASEEASFITGQVLSCDGGFIL